MLGLILVAVGAMRGMQGHISAAPAEAAALLGVAFLANAGFQAAGALLFAGLERSRALTVGLVSGNRNVTLVWAAAAPALAGHPGVELFLAMSVFPIFILPLATRRLFAAVERAAAAPVPAAPPRPATLPAPLPR